MKRQEKFFLFFLFIILVLIRLYHLGVPPLEIEESWRQADTESMAWNFANYDFNPFHPNLNYDGPLPNIPALEIQVTTYVIAILYKVFGHYYFLARLVPLTFYMLSALYLYLFARLHMSWRGALFSLLIYGILPINVYYSRAVMPESAALMFWIGGLYYFNLWVIGRGGREETVRKEREAPSPPSLFLSSVFLSLAIMTKPPVAFVAIPMIYLCFQYFKWEWLKLPELWGYALVTLALPACYYYFSGRLAEYKFTLGISRDIILKKALTAFYSQEAFHFFSESIPKTVGMIGFLLVFAGVWSLTKKQRVILVWFAAMLLEVIFIVSPIRAMYYLIFVTVPCALLIGNLLERIFYEPTGIVLSLVLILVMMYDSYSQVKPMYKINEIIAAQVQVVQEVTAKEDFLVLGSLDPCLLSLADRRGWRYNLRIYSSTPENPYEELAYYIERGAKYFVPIQGKVYGDEDDKIMSYIEERYPRIEPVKGYPIYFLQ